VASEEKSLNWNSRNITQGWQKGATAFYYGLGFSEADFSRAQVGIGVPLLEGNLCNVHAYPLAKKIEHSCREAGLLGFVFGVPAVSDNITQGYPGGNASLPSRNMIAAACEAVCGAHGYDAVIGMHHCDKNGPGFALGMMRLNFPSLIVNGGSIGPGCFRGEKITILDVYDSQAAVAAGDLAPEVAEGILRAACPGPGGCGIAASFNTWGIVLEVLGWSMPGSSSNPAESPEKDREIAEVGAALRFVLEQDLRPSRLITRESMIDAIAAVAAMGGSTKIDFNLRDIAEVLKRTPVLCTFAPRGKMTMLDLHLIGGTPALIKHFLAAGVLRGEHMTITGKSLRETYQSYPDAAAGQQVLRPTSDPINWRSDLQICYGNLAPDGIVFKVSSLKDGRFSGRAICFRSAQDVADAAAAGKIQPGHIVVLAYLGPVAAGMPEVLVASAALNSKALYGKVALISDTRVSGVTHGAVGVHCCPEAAVGGPIGLVEDGDVIEFDLDAGTVEWRVEPAEVERRRQRWHWEPTYGSSSYLATFARHVTGADRGCVPG
jgi:dihydroxy-acid dehydratase